MAPSGSGKSKAPKSAAGRLPVRCLSIFFPGHKFKLISLGKPADATSGREFLVSLTLPSRNNAEFKGRGKLEKLARHKAAEAALKFFEIPGCDKMVKYGLPSDIKREVNIEGITNANAVGYVNKLFGPEAKFSDPVQISVNDTPLWKAILSVQGHTFEQTGPNKKKAKQAVAITCIKTLENKDLNIVVPSMKLSSFEDSLMELMCNTLRKYTSSVPKCFHRFRNVAGVYLHDINSTQVKRSGLVTLAAGADHVDQEYSTNTGTIMHDCNAEVLALRAFRLFLYSQISEMLSISGRSEQLFVEKDIESGLFKLKDNFQVILILNNPPAGDALVFKSISKQMTKNVYKHLLNCHQEKPGALQFPMRVMKSDKPKGVKYFSETHFQENNQPVIVSPSDKLCLRNVVGVQGALLTQLMLPVYVTKYVVSKTLMAKQEALERAIYGRVEQHLLDIELPFKVTKPEFSTATCKLPVDRMYGKFAGNCQNMDSFWEIIHLSQGLALGDRPKVLSQNTDESQAEFVKRKLEAGRQIESSLVPSSLCKVRLFEKFCKIFKNLSHNRSVLYKESKAEAKQYQVTKSKVKKAFATAELGSWPCKNVDTNNFRLD
ncbi:hypothetical protein ACHWQZ_G014896 [Mnemiopsis leidyi]